MPRFSAAISLVVTLTILAQQASAMPVVPEPPRQPVPASAILNGFDRLGVVGSVLYVAAHPDDENTRLLAWLANQRHLDTAYVSLTRGEGGQNLIGSELGHALGRIRTFELLAARRIDGARQYFTRAVDFGYSKTAAETLAIWGHDRILGDLVRVIRTHRPDIIITRFSTSPPNHGHHTASAILAAEAFRLAAEPAHVDGLAPHTTRHLYENKSHWRFKETEDLSRFLSVDANAFDPLTGQSPAEVAARSRSQHKSQGFGTAPAFGKTLEYFEHIQSSPPSPTAPATIFDGLDFHWSRFSGTAKVVAAHRRLVETFDPRVPASSASALVAFVKAVESLPATSPLLAHHCEVRLRDAAALLAQIAGLVIESRSSTRVITPGQSLELEFEAIQRATMPPVHVVSITTPDGYIHPHDESLAIGTAWRAKHSFTLSATDDLTSSSASPRHPNPARAIEPDPRNLLYSTVRMRIAGCDIQIALPATHVVVDPVHGEQRTALEVAPLVTVTPDVHPDSVLPLVNGNPTTLRYRVTAFGAARAGRLRPRTSSPVSISPNELPFKLDEGGSADLVFELKATPSSPDTTGLVAIDVLLDTQASPIQAIRRDVLHYDHLPPLALHASADISVSVFALKTGATRKIGYIPGADDGVMLALQRAGYDVDTFDPSAPFTAGKDPLDTFDAVVIGIRALNVRPELEGHHTRLMRFVEQGGRLVWQYNVSSRFRPLGAVKFGPSRLDVGAERITDETSEMLAIPTPDGRTHALLSTPNAFSSSDAGGWVQERGLYFASSWEPPWLPVLRLSDPGEAPLDGALMWAPHGRGAVIYTGLSFFRQLPAGVPGAFRLFANLVARSEGRR